MSRIWLLWVLSLLAPALSLCVRADDVVIPDDHWAMVKNPGDSLEFLFTKGTLWGSMSFYGDGVPWAWTKPSSNVFGENGILDLTAPFVTQAKTADTPAKTIAIHEQAEKTGPHTVKVRSRYRPPCRSRAAPSNR